MSQPRPDPVQPADDDARALARDLLTNARHAALAYTDPATGTPGISRIAFGLAPDGCPLTLVSSLEQQAAQAPEVERQLSAYARQLQQLQSQYDLISARKAEADTALRLEEENHAEHFSLLERAIAPAYATGGGGRKIALAGAVSSVILGIALAFLMDLLNPVLRSARQMERELDIRPVITLPVLNLHPAASDPWITRMWHRLRRYQLRSS